MRKWSSLKNSPRASIEFANEIDRVSLASVTLEGSCATTFPGVDWRSIDRKSKAAEPSKGRVSRGRTDDPKKKKPVTYRAFFTNGFHPQTSRNSFSRPESRVIAGYQPGLHPRNNASSAHAYGVKHSLFQEEEILADSRISLSRRIELNMIFKGKHHHLEKHEKRQYECSGR